MKKTKKGFTLVELIIVIAVMAILVAIAIPTIASVTNTAKINTYNTNAATIESSIKTFRSLCDSKVKDDDGNVYTWSDSDGTAMSGYLTSQGLDIDGTFYILKSNLSVLEVNDNAAAADVLFTMTFASGTVTSSDGVVPSWTAFA